MARRFWVWKTPVEHRSQCVYCWTRQEVRFVTWGIVGWCPECDWMEPLLLDKWRDD